MRIIRNIANLESVLGKRRQIKDRVCERVAKILKEVKTRGDIAVCEYTKKLDKVKITPKNIRVTESEISAAFNEINSRIVSALKVAIDNVTRFYKANLPRPVKVRSASGKTLIAKYVPIERVGVYVPAGTAPLVSSVYMTVIPAVVAGVKEIVLCSPPNQYKTINPYILSVASLLKIKEVYKIGGAQAIAALAYGTKTIKKVDKIVGPGNEYVTEAKRQAFGAVDIDMLAGPSEVVIVADKGANPDYIIADLEAQLEHHSGWGVVVTTSKKIANALRKIRLNSAVLRVRNLAKAAEVVNIISPEHLEVFLKKPKDFVRNITNAGAVFIGEYSPAALGDYTAGPSHVLPTAGAARYFSPLSIFDFLKEMHIINYSKRALAEEVKALEEIASLEGMKKHIESVRKRVNP